MGILKEKIKKFLKKETFAGQVLASALIKNVVIFCVLIILGFFFIYEREKDFQIELFKKEGYQLQRHMEQKLEKFKSDTVFISSLPPITGIMRAYYNENIDPIENSTYDLWVSRLETIFKNYMKTESSYFQMRYIGVANGGKEIVRVDRLKDQGTIVAKTKKELQNKSEEFYYKDILESESDIVYLSAVSLNREYGVVQEPKVYTVRAAFKVRNDQGEIFGFVIINANIQNWIDSNNIKNYPNTIISFFNSNNLIYGKLKRQALDYLDEHRTKILKLANILSFKNFDMVETGQQIVLGKRWKYAKGDEESYLGVVAFVDKSLFSNFAIKNLFLWIFVLTFIVLFNLIFTYKKIIKKISPIQTIIDKIKKKRSQSTLVV